ncbi:MAG TPA: hypothetical protein VF773_15345 [Verrucomicrobiae bacterium]
MSERLFVSDSATGTQSKVGGNDEIMDLGRYMARWGFTKRHGQNLLAKGMPHLLIGRRRVRIIVAESDAWLKQQFGKRRIGKAGGAK